MTIHHMIICHSFNNKSERTNKKSLGDVVKSDSATELQATWEVPPRPNPNAYNSECFFKDIHEHIRVSSASETKCSL